MRVYCIIVIIENNQFAFEHLVYMWGIHGGMKVVTMLSVELYPRSMS